jgi:translocator protein
VRPPQLLVALFVFLVPPFLVSAIGSQWTDTGAGSWYDGLQRPDWEPPGWAFGVVWSLLYLAMGIAAWLVWRAGGPTRSVTLPLAAWAVQLLLNLSWTFAFFRLESTGAGLVFIVLLWFAILATIVLFLAKSKLAAALIVPYLAWVTYAAALNLEIWRLN